MKSLRGKPEADRGLGSRETERQTAKDEKINEQDDTEGAKMRGQMRMRQKKGSERKRDGEAWKWKESEKGSTRAQEEGRGQRDRKIKHMGWVINEGQEREGKNGENLNEAD